MMAPDQIEKRLLLLEKALRESESRFSSIVSITGFAVIMVDETQNIIFFNNGAERIFGYASFEVIGRPLDLLMPDRFAQSHRADIRAFEADTATLSRSMKERKVEIVGRRKAGSEFPADVSISKWEKDGKTVFTAIVQDITERKFAEESLKEEYALRRAIEESVTSGIAAADITGKIIYVNPAFCRIFGWSKEEFLGTTLPHLFWPPEETEKIMKVFQKNMNQTGPPSPDELIFRRKNEERFPVLVLASPLRDENGNIFGALGSFIDISEKKMMEEELNKVEKLKSLGVLAGGIAHDFNNILTAILGNISLAKSFIESKEQLLNRLTEAEKASLRASELAQQLLTFSKGGAPVKKIISIQSLIEHSVKFALTGSNVQSQLFFQEGLWPVEADEGQMSQVIQNLIINAQQAMPLGGTIRIDAKNASMDESVVQDMVLRKGNYLVISIQDQGTGIPKGQLSKIFDPYFTTKEKGSGLGLSITHSIIKRHQGYITAESNPGSGTTFFIYLPASPQSSVPQEKNESEEMTRGKGRVLIMDDEESVLNIAGEILTHLGYEVDLAKNGTEAVRIYKKAKDSGHSFDVVITDLTVPGDISGIETLRRLREIDSQVKVIVSSGYSNDPAMADCKTFGFSECLRKPYRAFEVSEAVKRVLKAGRSGDQPEE